MSLDMLFSNKLFDILSNQSSHFKQKTDPVLIILV
ncbi:hypothetical protein LRU_00547 [Ligilactobacillus ruminis SPM0211]|uniref:Uncharacterized protein n=1 Tax=Ligilactobacillus ruminis SPM0211 TaxID=1040964 RepID=F7QYQ6_9LACO|nr:hypothetical protein LRU_00547 [Ligilactobacillus ruminis SPM0211]